MDVIYTIFFIVFSLSIITSALGVILFKKLVYSTVSLITCFLSVAGIYILLNADFVAISQIMIYAVGITIIMIFAIMLTSKESEKKLWISLNPLNISAVVVALVFLSLIIWAIHSNNNGCINQIFNFNLPNVDTINAIKDKGTSPVIGNKLFTTYLIPFELLSVLLLAALIGAVVMTKSDFEKIINPTTETSVDEIKEERG